MQLTAAELGQVVAEGEHASEAMLSIPLTGLVNGALISGVLWVVLIWMVYQIVG